MLQCRPAQEFSFGPRALKDALVSTDPALQRLYVSTFSPAERLFLSEAYNPQRTLFCTLLIRTAFDWLLSHPEAPEDFQTFHASLQHRKQSLARKHIYLQPIDLSEGPVGGSLLDSLRSCTEAFFLGLRVKCLPSVAAESIHCSSRPSRDSDRLQLHTDGILSFLKNNKPGDALCVLGLTLSDLYPRETWSYTFGKFLPGHGHVPRTLPPTWPGELPLAPLPYAGCAQPGRGAAAAAGPLPHLPAEAAARPGLQAPPEVQETPRLDSGGGRDVAQPGVGGAVCVGGQPARQCRLGHVLR
uniref:Archaelysin family metallopeptidase 1 n=1 Tax=Microcebus murinus TaxID=30608 RepID=A0A8C5ULK9_MICMU